MQSLRVEAFKARKAHRCAWCAEPIESGAAYLRNVYLHDGLRSDPLHPECYAAMNRDKYLRHDCDGEYECGAQKRGKTIEESEDARAALSAETGTK